MKKRIAALVIMGIMTFSMAACGSSSDEGSAGSSSDTAADTAADDSAEDTEADGLSGSGRARHEKMRHFCDIRHHRPSADIFSDRKTDFRLCDPEFLGLKKIPELYC